MTPMIDIVFQLIVFFLLVMDLSRRKVEPLELPPASEARVVKPADPNEVIINILHDGSAVLDGQHLDDESLENFFRNRRAVPAFRFGPRGDLTTYPIVIRADRGTEWIHVQKVMSMASQLGGVFRVHMAATLPRGPQ